MTQAKNQNLNSITKDARFKMAIDLFNSSEWYSAHDAFEELWHETYGPERTTIQGFLQIAVAQVHLESGNNTGATILLGEALGRLRRMGTPDLGLDIECLCKCVESRLRILQGKSNTELICLPVLQERT